MITARWLKGKQFEVEIRGHKLLLDLPVKDGGQDEGPTPTELLGASLAACACLYALPALERRGHLGEGLEVTAKMERRENPKRVGRVELTLCLPHNARGKVTGTDLETIKRAAHTCYVQRSIVHVPEIDLKVEAE